MAIPLSKDGRAALAFLNGFGGGFTAGTVARECGWSSRSEMATFRHQVLGHLLKVGLVDLIDREKPAIYVITNEGRYALLPPPPVEEK